MKNFCFKLVDGGGGKCLRVKGHADAHSFRQDSEEPPLDKLLLILEYATETAYVWERIAPFSTGNWLTWMADEGLIVEEPRDGHYIYAGFSWASLAPLTHITDKGRELLAQHAKVEW